MNVPGMRFCGQCGARLAVPLDCPVCSFLNAAGMRFCGRGKGAKRSNPGDKPP